MTRTRKGTDRYDCPAHGTKVLSLASKAAGRWTVRIMHHISHTGSPAVRAELAAMDVEVAPLEIPASGLYNDIVVFDIGEDQPNWPVVARWVARRNALDLVSTAFTGAEIAAAAWLELDADWHGGYPLPDNGDWHELTYDPADYCAVCGIGARQKAPFRLKQLRWGRRSIRQLNWVFDEFFVTPQLYEEEFAPRGIGSREVHDRKGVPLDDIVQLDVTETVDVDTGGLVVDSQLGRSLRFMPGRLRQWLRPVRVCRVCGRPKYLPVVRGPAPEPLAPPAAAMAKSAAWFGSGGAAHRLVLVSHELAGALAARQVRGASLRPATRTGAAGSQR
jgi:hypothetical protein